MPHGTEGPLQELEFVTTPRDLNEVVDAVAAAPLVAVDTEFVRETTYYPQLCVVQVATAELVASIDCLASLDLAPLAAALMRADCTWLVHSARQDLEVVFQTMQRLPQRLIDTQMAAALTGMPPQIGLEGLLARTLNVVLGESFARTDWSKRPLPPPALAYALDDVRYLAAAWHELERQLAELERLDWLEEDGARNLAEPPVADPVAIWTRLKGARVASAAQHAAALALVEWREEVAQKANRPRRWILADDVLLAIAQAMPKNVGGLTDVAPAKLAARFGDAVLAAVARNEEPRLREIVAGQTVRIADKQQVRQLQELVRTRAGQLGIEPEILATRRDLAALAVGTPPAHLVTGWRAAVLADTLAAAASF